MGEPCVPLSGADSIEGDHLVGDSPTSSSDEPHICIVGAGISGLRCAEVLLKHGIRVTIFEARDRIGGRICQSAQLGYPVDLGPQWIHTSGENPMLSLAHKSKTPLHSWNERLNLFDEHGELVPEDKAVFLSDLRWAIIEEAIEYSRLNSKNIGPDESLDMFIRRRAKEELPERGSDEKLLLGMAEMWGCYIGDKVERQSLKFACMEECCVGEELIVTSTYAGILDEVSRPALQKASINLNTKVTTISTRHPNHVNLTTAIGTTHTFTSAVLTTPLGWLKRNLSAFSPPLPPHLSHAITSISVGHLEKVLITFPTVFWAGPPTPANPNPTSSFPSYTNWLSPQYVPPSNPTRLTPQECYNLAAFPPPHSHPTLLFYTYAPLSLHIAHLAATLPPPALTATLWSYYQPYVSLLPHYSSIDPDCTPTAILATSWAEDELAGYGSYCNFQVGMEDAEGAVKALREGVPERGLWFAGEHASPVEECGTVAGAYLSGEGVGEKIVGVHGKEKGQGADGS